MKHRRPKEHIRRYRRSGKVRLINKGLRYRQPHRFDIPRVVRVNPKLENLRRAEELAMHEQLYGDKTAANMMRAQARVDFNRKIKKKSVNKDSRVFKASAMTEKEFKRYLEIADMARKKGYALPKINQVHGPLVIDEINIPDNYMTYALFIPDTDIKTDEETALVLIDDDSPKKVKELAFAHELGHVHLDYTNQKNTESGADKVGADIMGVPLHEMQDLVLIRDVFSGRKKQKKRR